MSEGRYGVSVRLGRGDGPRAFHVEATDAAGHTATSVDETVHLVQ
jgi:hypothetical protein